MTDRRRHLVLAAAVAGPVAVAAGATLLRGLLAAPGAALLLVLVVVAVGAVGDRLAGLVAALSAAASFDFFLAVPYYRFAILDRDDLETTVLLLAIGVAVTEIGLWGRRQRARTRRIESRLDAVARAARMGADGTPTADHVAAVALMITEVLDLDDTRFDASTAPTGRPVLQRDGTVTLDGQSLDVARHGLPTMDAIELPAGRDAVDGRFLLVASTTLRRPGPDDLQVAITLAEQVTALTVTREQTGARTRST